MIHGAAWRRATLAMLTTLILHDTAAAAPAHPMDALTPDEIKQTVQVLRDAGKADAQTRFPMITLREPAKADVLAWSPGQPLSRQSYVVVKSGAAIFEGVVDLTGNRVASWTRQDGVQPNILLEEWIAAQEITAAHPGWQAAMQKRGVDTEKVFCAPLSAGYFALPGEEGRRLLKVPCFDLRGTKNHWFGKPIEGLFAVVDLNAREVVEVIDTGIVPISTDTHDYDEASVGALRAPLKPVRMTSADGGNYGIDGGVISWQKWRFHVRFDRRQGAIISNVAYRENGETRSVLYQGALSEIFVPYMDPDIGWSFRTYMDAGEYGFGLLTSPLMPGSDCPAAATYLDATIADDEGNPLTLEGIACLFERNAGDPAWRHFEILNETHESRPQVDLVFRTMSTIGNYDYAVDWVFDQRGNITVRVGATGIDAVKGVATRHMSEPTAAADTAYGMLVAPNLVAIYHDHFFSFRLDLDIDGQDNSFVLDRRVQKQLDTDSARRSIWVIEPHVAQRDSSAKFNINLQRPAVWRVINPNRDNAVGNPTSYQLMPMGNASMLLGDDDFPLRRAAFSKHHLWVTPHDADEIFAAGRFPNQSKGDDGLPAWTKAGRSIVNRDIVLWYTLGFSHVTRSEDWPIMPTKWHAFMLRPFNFFDRNPALDLRGAPVN